MIRTVLSAVVVGGLLVGGWAIAGENCAKSCAKTVAGKEGGCCQEKVAFSQEAMKALNANAAYQRASELEKSWSETPAKLVAMNDGEKAALAASAEKMAGHPASGVIKPSIELVRESLATAVQMDKAAADMCAAQCKLKGEATSADAKPACPKAAAAKLRFEQSAGYVMKASHLIGKASKAAGECGGKSECAKAKKVADAGEGCAKTKQVADSGEGCPKAKAAAMAKAEGGCPKAAAQAKAAEGDATLVAAKADGEKSCPKAAAAKAEGGCPKAAAQAKAAEGDATLVAAKADGEKTCNKTAKADGEKTCAKTIAAAGEGEKSCAKTAAMAKADGEKPCPKALAAKAEALINDSGKLLAQWQEANVTLASMDTAARTSVEEACASTMAKCPVGRLMPETLSTARELLVEATRLSAQCKAEAVASKKEIPAEMKELMEARMLLISSAINVLDRTCAMAKPSKQMAMAN